MALLKIVPYGNQLLRKQAEVINNIDDEIKTLIENMKETMDAAGGVGLAAPQVGVSKMLFLVNWSKVEEMDQDWIEAFINPEILSTSDDFVSIQEGCLSLPELWADVFRPEKIHVKYTSLEGETIEKEMSGFPARVFQHEFDHLLGILFIDRIPVEERTQIKTGIQEILDGTIKPFDGKPVEEPEQTV